MDVNGAIEHIEESVRELEKEMYNFSTVAIPRFEKDKEILNQMRDQIIKLKALKQKIDKKENVSAEEIDASVPEAFR